MLYAFAVSLTGDDIKHSNFAVVRRVAIVFRGTLLNKEMKKYIGPFILKVE